MSMSINSHRLAFSSYSNKSTFIDSFSGIYGIHDSHQIPNILCDRSSNDVFLNQHLQWYHNFDSLAARKLVRAVCNNMNINEPIFNPHELIIKRNVSVESYKCMFYRKNIRFFE